MPDRDLTPTPGRPSVSSDRGRKAVPDGGDRVESADPPTVRSGLPPGSNSGGSANRQTKSKATRADLPSLPVPGDRVGDFGLEEAIGSGGMGAVFRAVDIKLDRQVALKILPYDQAVDPEVVQRYYQEGRAAARLDHENIARIYSIGHDGPYHFICFEYIEGTTIRQRVERDGPMAVDDAINYTLQIANALVHAAERGVVHRDIKPSNIIVTPQGRAKLVDMGLARRFERGEDTGLTQSGMTLGTFDYISPEQARDPRDVDVRGDLYSLGCTLFHMLSGRPPFPEGTVLQKLIQHQEDAPPDIRKLNPAVHDDLASILVKLMAKDRDRRYQTPELLVRDLLTVAGSLGLRSINPEGLVWMAPTPAPAWTRHVVWAVPVLAFLVVMGGLAWWGDGLSNTAENASNPPPPPTRTVALPPKLPRATVVEPEREAPIERTVGSRDDLVQLLLDSPARSTFLLSDKGPYDLRSVKPGVLKGLEFTIKAEAEVRPVIRLSREPGETAPAALLDLIGGRATLEGLDFLVDGPDTQAAIRAEDADLMIRRCSFRRAGSSPFRSKSAAVQIKTTPRSNARSTLDRRVGVSIEASEFDAGQVGVLASGLVDLGVRDCTFGPASRDQANFWLENSDPLTPPAQVRISHLSVLAGSGPVFRIEGTSPRIRVDDSVFAPPTSSTTLASAAPTLVAIDSADRLDWQGFGNLYGRFGMFLQRPAKLGSKASIATFNGWVDDPASFRESGSILSEAKVWSDPDPLETLAVNPSGPTRAFRLILPRPTLANLGARQGPLGPLPGPLIVASAPPSPVLEAQSPSKVRVEPVPTPTPSSTATNPRTATKLEEPPTEPGDLKEMPIASTADRKPSTRTEDADAPTGSAELIPMPPAVDPERFSTSVIVPNPPAVLISKPDAASPSLVVGVESNVIRTLEKFKEAMNQPVASVKTLTLAADADWVVPPFAIRGMTNLVIRGEQAAGRPRLRFRADAPAPLSTLFPAIAAALPEPWAAWITLHSGGLKLEGIDLVLPEIEGSTRRRAAFAIAPGSNDLTLTDCSVTIEGDNQPSAVVALLPGEPGGEVRVWIKNSLLRSGGDLIDVAAGRRLEVEVDDALIATGGTLLHAHGLPEGRTPEPIRLALHQVTGRMLGGLAHLQSSAGEPELPVTEIKTRDSIFATGDPGDSLLRVDGQGDIESLGPLIHWDGRATAYHLINIYRRDHSTRPGAMPKLYHLDFWNLKLGRFEESATHGDLKFLTPWDPSRHPWTLRPDDARLDPESPAASLGADLIHIPNPPGR
jgi:serine/threonine protein kinase